MINGRLAALNNVETEMKGAGAARVLVTTRTYHFSDDTEHKAVEETPCPEPEPVAPPPKAAKKKKPRKSIFGGKKSKK